VRERVASGDLNVRFISTIAEFFFAYSLGATPIESAGRAPDENEVINYASKERNYRAYIRANYRLPCQKINI
jgi:hypothetical protein